MQAIIGTMSIVIVVIAMFVQTLWIIVGRRGRDRYLKDIAKFRRPSSSWSRYYKWRVESLRNSILDGIIFEILLIAILFSMILTSVELYEIPSLIPIVLLVIALSFLSSIQNAFKIKGLNEREVKIASQIEAATDKIATARNLAVDLISAGTAADGRVWFALYKVGQRQDPVGWAVRDVLLDSNLKHYQQSGSIDSPQDSSLKVDETSDSEGPGIR